jgi:Do/DeqQ family serine protease
MATTARPLWQLIALSLMAGLVGAATFGYINRPAEGPLFAHAPAESAPDNYRFGAQNAAYASGPDTGGPANISTDFVTASAASTPAVVFIKTVSEAQNTNGWMDWFFNGGGGSRASTGSGVIFTPDGYVVTNNHVVNDAENIEVVHEKRTYKAKIVGTDPSCDLAVLKIDGKRLPSIRVGDSKKVQVGEWVLAVGNPFNLTSTVTAGIVSAKGRNLNIVNSQFPIESFIQTDAAINPGNSGGALVNLKGDLIGINTAIYSQTGSYAGYGFAVPSDLVEKVVGDLIKFGRVQKAVFGADVTELNSGLAEKLNTTDLSGVAVASLDADGPADRAGMRKGDIIEKVDGKQINSKAEFDEEIYYHSPGDKIKVTYRRKDQLSTAELTLVNLDGGTAVLKREIYKSSKLGAQLERLSKNELGKYKVEGGVRIVRLEGNGILRRMGITEGFAITSINNKPVTSPQDLEDTLLAVSGRILIEGLNQQGQKGYYQFYF